MTFFDLVLQTTASLHMDDEPEEYISEHTGFVRADSEDGAVGCVGKVHTWRIQAQLAAANDKSLFLRTSRLPVASKRRRPSLLERKVDPIV